MRSLSLSLVAATVLIATIKLDGYAAHPIGITGLTLVTIAIANLVIYGLYLIFDQPTQAHSRTDC